MPRHRLNRAFYHRDVVTVARSLLGQRLVRVLPDGMRLAGIIVETEAYLGIPDLAAHTCNGRRTARNASMWQDGGTAYVYFTYGMHHCFNVVAEKQEQPVAALIRALEPVEGMERMYAHRARARRDVDLCSGPAKLCEALSINRTLDGVDMVTSKVLFIEQERQRAYSATRIRTTPRIGIAYAGEWTDKPLRFCLRNHPHVSR